MRTGVGDLPETETNASDVSGRSLALRERGYRRQTLLAAVGVLLALLSAAMMLAGRYVVYRHERTFQSAAWTKATPDQRSKMALDPALSIAVEGRTRRQVRNLLGPPDSRSDADSYYYDLGPGGLLLVPFHADGRAYPVTLLPLLGDD